MSTCSAVFCYSRASKRIEGITFHRYPKDPKRREAWLEAVNRKDFRPSANSALCSLHFEEDMFYRTPYRVILNSDAVPTIFPACHPNKMKITTKSKKQPRDPPIVAPQKGVFIGPDLKTIRAINSASLRQRQLMNPVTPIAIDKATKPKPLSDRNAEAQVTEESENQAKDSSTEQIVPLKPNIKLVSPIKSQEILEEHRKQIIKPEIQESDSETAQDTVNITVDNTSSNNNLKKKPAKRPKKAFMTDVNSMLKVHMVCAYCQKACINYLNIKSHAVKQDIPKQTTNTEKVADTEKQHLRSQLQLVRGQVERLQLGKEQTRKKVKLLNQTVRRLKDRQKRLKQTLKSILGNKEEELVVIGSINGVLTDDLT